MAQRLWNSCIHLLLDAILAGLFSAGHPKICPRVPNAVAANQEDVLLVLLEVNFVDLRLTRPPCKTNRHRPKRFWVPRRSGSHESVHQRWPMGRSPNKPTFDKWSGLLQSAPLSKHQLVYPASEEKPMSPALRFLGELNMQGSAFTPCTLAEP